MGLSPRNLLLRLLAAFTLVFLSGPNIIHAQVPDAVDSPEQKPEETKQPLSVEGYQAQPGDDPLKPFVPAQPLTPEQQARSKAMPYFMAGQLKEKKRDFEGAYADYQKALEADPKGAGIYKALVPVTFRLNRQEEALEYAFKAVELDPDDYVMLRKLGGFMAAQRKIPEAIDLLVKAGKSSRLDPNTVENVMINRDLAILYSAIGDLEKAASNYVIVFDAMINPQKYSIDFQEHRQLLSEEATSFERIGQAFLVAERYELAIQAFERAVESRRGSPGTLSYYLAQVYVQTKEFDKALENLQKYFDAQLQSKGREAYELLADILKSLDKEEELIPRLEKMAERDARNSTLSYFLADQYLAANRLQDAQEIYLRVLEGNPDPEGYRGLANIYRLEKEPARFVETAAKALGRDLDPTVLDDELSAAAKDKDFVKSLVEQGQKLIDQGPSAEDIKSLFLLGRIVAEGENLEAGVEFLKAALKEASGAQLGAIYSELGTQLMVADKYEEAAKILQDAANDPALVESRPNYLYRLSQAQELAGETEAALKSIREAQSMIPEHPLLQYQEGWIHYHAQQWNDAIRIFEKVIEKYRDQNEIVRRAQFSLSNVYVQMGNIRKGEEILEDVLKENPDDPSVNNDLGYLYADQGKNLEQAEKMIRKALDAEPKNGAYLDSMAWVLYKLGRYEEAIKYMERATETPSGKDATIQEHLGDILERLERTQEAVEAWTRALKAAQEEGTPDQKLITRLKDKLKSQEGVGEAPSEKPAIP